MKIPEHGPDLASLRELVDSLPALRVASGHHAERVEEEDQGKSLWADPLSVLHVTVS